jgi:uncharacterized protein (DUF983 family)
MPDTLPARWVPNRSLSVPAWPVPALRVAVFRGLRGVCPACGGAKIFQGWLRVRAACPACTAPLGALRADDAPPYVVIFIVGHLVIGTQVMLERVVVLSAWTEAAIFLPLTLVLALGLLRPVKGAVLGLMLRLGMVTPPAVPLAENPPHPRAADMPDAA